MAKSRTIYVCAECGGTSLKWQGKCPHCSAWNTLEETVESAASSAGGHRYAPLAAASPVAVGVVRLWIDYAALVAALGLGAAWLPGVLP